MNAFAVKGPDGKFDTLLEETEDDCKRTYMEGRTIQDWKWYAEDGYTCVPVTVSEAGQAEGPTYLHTARWTSSFLQQWSKKYSLTLPSDAWMALMQAAPVAAQAELRPEADRGLEDLYSIRELDEILERSLNLGGLKRNIYLFWKGLGYGAKSAVLDLHRAIARQRSEARESNPLHGGLEHMARGDGCPEQSEGSGQDENASVLARVEPKLPAGGALPPSAKLSHQSSDRPITQADQREAQQTPSTARSGSSLFATESSVSASHHSSSGQFVRVPREPTVIKDFPGEAVEQYRKEHRGMLPADIDTIQRWRNDALEAAANIAIRYGQHDIANDIRALIRTAAPAEQPSSDATRIVHLEKGINEATTEAEELGMPEGMYLADLLRCLPRNCAAEQPAAEPVAEVTCSNWNGMNVCVLADVQPLPVGTKLYTHPPSARVGAERLAGAFERLLMPLVRGEVSATGTDNETNLLAFCIGEHEQIIAALKGGGR